MELIAAILLFVSLYICTNFLPIYRKNGKASLFLNLYENNSENHRNPKKKKLNSAKCEAAGLSVLPTKMASAVTRVILRCEEAQENESLGNLITYKLLFSLSIDVNDSLSKK